MSDQHPPPPLTVFGLPVKLPATVTVRVTSENVELPVEVNLVEEGGFGSRPILTLDTDGLADAVLAIQSREFESQGAGGVRPNDVPVKPIREEALRQVAGHVLTWSELARRCGWYTSSRPSGHQQPDSQRVKRALGLRLSAGTKGYVRYETAERLAEALSRDPVDLGF